MRTQQVKTALDTFAADVRPDYTPVDTNGRIMVGGAILAAIQTAVEDTTPATVTGNVGYTPSNAEYETVAASQTAQVIGSTGATGDFISHLVIIPATTSPGNVLLLDNATSITLFAGGASSVSNLAPFVVYLGMKSVSGAWKITTGTNVSCIAVGDFT